MDLAYRSGWLAVITGNINNKKVSYKICLEYFALAFSSRLSSARFSQNFIRKKGVLRNIVHGYDLKIYRLEE